jgi:DnaJ-domain-containing protein 1
MDELTIYKSPEEEELAAKKAELETLESELAENELKLTTFQAELHRFEQQYLGLIGSRYTELERIEEQITEYMDYLESSRNFKPSDGLKKLYREVAKRVHPDLATDEVERAKRQNLMAAANQAYEEGDEQGLREILSSWESDPHSVQGEGVAAELIRVIRQIAQCRSRLVAINRDMAELRQTELFELKEQVEQAKQSGQDLLAEMAKHLDEQITEAQERLQDLKEQLGV